MSLTILLAFSLILIMMSVWSLNTFIRLQQATKQYDSDEGFRIACKISTFHVSVGLWVAIVVLILSLALLAFLSYKITRAS